ncbi:hypothetical protein KQX54_006041 [Cotesia glomerata]|uniref:Uncharacterized protein n=1 Tax=Cotesia glomerata TaxID=32391 RepID=A0AAV7I3Y7_COTGL|nr:hypothetical protein KQX54_006041 [Cotesia glomerata]
MHTLTAAVQPTPIPKHVDTTRNLPQIERGWLWRAYPAPVTRASSPVPHADPQSFTHQTDYTTSSSTIVLLCYVQSGLCAQVCSEYSKGFCYPRLMGEKGNKYCIDL